ALFVFFKQEQSEKDIDKKMDEDEKTDLQDKTAGLDDAGKQKAAAEYEAFKKSKEYQELKKLKREDELKKAKEKAIEAYLKILTKPDDPYEPLEQKVDEDAIRKLFAQIASVDNEEFKPENLEVKGNKIFINDEGALRELEIDGLQFEMKAFRFYPEGSIGANMTGFVSYSGDDSRGQYGLEGFFNEELTGVSGSIKTERSAHGELIIMNDREYTKPKNGSDLVLTIDRTIQFTACQKLNEAVKKHGADGGSVVIMDPDTGAILAMCSNPDYDPNHYRDVEDINIFNNQVVFSQYEPGSIFKGITMAMGIDQEKIMPQTTFTDTGSVKIADYEIKNSDLKAHGVIDMNGVLRESLNTGTIFVMRKIGADVFRDYVKNFGFGEKTGIELEGESTGDIKNLVKDKMNKELYAATASFGQGIAVTPLQMINAFAAMANGGILMKPYLVKEVILGDGSRIVTQPKQIRRVISERGAMIMSGMLVNVVENGHGKRAGVKGYYVAGKTGTAQLPKKDGRGYEKNAHIGSFAGFAPANNPKFAMLVRLDNPRDVEWAESSAAPLFGEISEFLLHYLQVPTERADK
ncbi:MAG: penicillin-binding transpeptidase domain-containing protein, partial [Patescibacteria group bacterium]